VLLQHFYSGLDTESAHCLDAAAGGSFSHKTLNEGMEILDRIIENNSFASKSKPSREEHTSSRKDNLVAESDLPLPSTSDSALESSPESGILEKEEIQSLELPFKFEDDLFEDPGNTSNYFCKRKPPVPVASTDPIEASFRRETVMKLTSIMSSEWSRELELSSEILRISSPTSTIPCTISGTLVNTLYSPTIGANIISEECVFYLLGNVPFVQTDKSFRASSGEILKGSGILQNVSVRHEDIDVILDFHVFDVRDFDLLIRHPIEKLLMDAPTQGKIDVRLGKETISVQIIRATNSRAEPTLNSEPIEEVKGILPIDSPESLLEKDAEKFIEEEDDSAEHIDPCRPPIELKPLPTGLCYAFLHGNTESPVIISDKLSEEESARLITVLEKHRTVLGYSLQDLKGISPALCTHRIPLDSTITP
jgi:hypothetical protein